MSKQPKLKSIVYLHKPTKQKYVIYHTQGDDHILEPISGPTLRATKEQLRDAEIWEKQ